MKKKILALIIALVMLAACLTVITVAADNTDHVADQIVLSVGKDETERSLAWFSELSEAGEVRLTEASNVTDGVFPSVYKTFAATSAESNFEDGKYSKKATITGLSENTRYAYVFAVGTEVSEIYYFDVGSFGDFDFVFIADPQLIKTSDGDKWGASLEKITSQLNPDLIVSGGDQVNTADDVDLYNAFIIDEMAGVTFAPTVGPGHEESPLYGEHYNLPNLSSKYGSNSTSSNYWYVYNNVLFINLNSSDIDAFSNGEHSEFVKEAIAANPDVDWNIVVTHYSLYSTGIHADEMVKYKDALAEDLTELGVDLVLSAHDHVYVRTHIMDGNEISDGLVVGDTAYAPEGTLYVECNSVSGTKFYPQDVSDQDWVEKDDYNRTCAIKFEVTETALSMKSYHLDDMSVFDSFTISKETPDTVQTDLTLSGVDVTLADGILLNFYIEPSEKLIGIDNAELVLKNGVECYKITVEVAAKEMGDDIIVQLKSADTKVGSPFAFSVKEYADDILDGDYDAVTKAVAEAMLNYGAAAQNYFEYDTDALVGTPVTDSTALKAVTAQGAEVFDEEKIFIGASLVLEGNMKLRFYFKGSVAVSIGGAPAVVVNKDGYCYADVRVAPTDFDKVYEVKCGSTTVKYSVFNYLVNGADDAELSEMVASIYEYGEAVNAYVSEHCTHIGMECDRVILPTMFSEGEREGFCNVCDKHVVEKLEKTEPIVRVYDSTTSGDDDFYRVNVYDDVLAGDHFYPTEEDHDGKSLFVEFSLLWNETLVNAYKDTPSSSMKGYVLLGSMEGIGTKFLDRPFWMALTNDNTELWCQYAGGVEPDNMGKVYEIFEGPTPSSDGGKDDFVNIGEFGWHRVGIEYRQTFIEKVDGSIEYTLYVNLYFDGVLVSSYDYIMTGSANARPVDMSYYLYTVEKVNGEYVYTDIPDNRYISAFRIQNPETVYGTAYFPYADMYISCGDSFVLDVEPIKNPTADSFEINGEELDGRIYFFCEGMEIKPCEGHADKDDDGVCDTFGCEEIFSDGCDATDCLDTDSDGLCDNEGCDKETSNKLSCDHENLPYTTVTVETMFSKGKKTAHCDVCGEDITVYVEETTPKIVKFNNSTTDVTHNLNVVRDVLDGKHFYPTEENPNGLDLFVEFSLLWNETLANSKKGWAEFARFHAKGKVKDYDSAFWYALKDDCSTVWCQEAGGFEYGTGDKVTFGPAIADGGEFPFIGEYGWHRIGIQIHQEVASVSGSTIKYKFTSTLYVDGVKTSVIEYSDMAHAANRLFTAEVVNGELVYSDIDSATTILAYRVPEQTISGGDAYFVTADTFITAGDGFVVDVTPVKNPANNTFKVATGVELNAKVFYEHTN